MGSTLKMKCLFHSCGRNVQKSKLRYTRSSVQMAFVNFLPFCSEYDRCSKIVPERNLKNMNHYLRNYYNRLYYSCTAILSETIIVIMSLCHFKGGIHNGKNFLQHRCNRVIKIYSFVTSNFSGTLFPKYIEKFSC